jgi:membrane protein CcdC involved in cytochrome C biogenesis
MLKVIVVGCIVLIGALVAMVASTPNSIRSFGLEKSEMTFLFFIIAHCFAVPEISMYVTYIFQGKLDD